jgi:aconitase B
LTNCRDTKIFQKEDAKLPSRGLTLCMGEQKKEDI